MIPLTPKQYQTLEFLKSYYKEHHYFPSTFEMMEHFKVKSTSSIFERIEHLVKKGYIEKIPNQARAYIIK